MEGSSRKRLCGLVLMYVSKKKEILCLGREWFVTLGFCEVEVQYGNVCEIISFLINFSCLGFHWHGFNETNIV